MPAAEARACGGDVKYMDHHQGAGMEDVLHKLIDVAAGRSNLPVHEADALHEAITPGYTAVPVSDEEVVAAQAIIDRAVAERAAKAAPADAEAEPAGTK